MTRAPAHDATTTIMFEGGADRVSRQQIGSGMPCMTVVMFSGSPAAFSCCNAGLPASSGGVVKRLIIPFTYLCLLLWPCCLSAPSVSCSAALNR